MIRVRNIPLGHYACPDIVRGSERILARATGEGTGSPG